MGDLYRWESLKGGRKEGMTGYQGRRGISSKVTRSGEEGGVLTAGLKIPNSSQSWRVKAEEPEKADFAQI